MSHIFVSYSRKDSDFVFKIVDSLKGMGLNMWVDKEDIPKGEDWEQKIYRGIAEADAFLFMISPDSAASEVCGSEIAHARKNNKRIIPILIRDTEPKTTRAEISKINWIYCRVDRDNLESAIEEINTTIHTNFNWVEFHTKLQTKALAWEERSDNSRLLRGNDLKEAETRLREVRAPKDPMPTALMRQYILKSRQVFDKQRKLPSRIGGMLAILITVLYVWSDKSWFRVWPIYPICPAVGQVTVVPTNRDINLEDAIRGEIEEIRTTSLPYCEQYSRAIMEVEIAPQLNSEKYLLTVILPNTPAYQLDFLPEIREFGPEFVSEEEAIKLINASSAYSVGEYELVVKTLEGVKNQSAATLKAQAYLYLDEFEKSRDSYDEAIAHAQEGNKPEEALYMGKALAWWMPGLSQDLRESSTHFDEFKLLNCEEARKIYLNVLSGVTTDSDYYHIFLIASHYCGEAGWQNPLELGVSPEKTGSLSLLSMSVSDLISENVITERNLESAGTQLLTARFELALYYQVHGDQSVYCEGFLASRAWFRERVFTKLDRENMQYLLRQSCG